MTNVSLAKSKRRTIIFSHYFGHAGEETQEKTGARRQISPKNGYLLIRSCEGRVKKDDDRTQTENSLK
jgi:hypothetical protein